MLNQRASTGLHQRVREKVPRFSEHKRAEVGAPNSEICN